MRKMLLRTLLILFAAMILSSCSNVDYGGRDTHKVYGDGVYAVLTHTRDGKIIRGINNRKYNQFIVDNILAMEETDENVYVYGEFTKHPIYVVIDIVDNNVKMYAEVEEGDTLCMTQLYNMIQAGDAVYLNDYEDFSESDRKIFDRMKKTL